MKHLHLPAVGVCALAATLLTGCVDNDYDLSNLDTTSQFEVKDLELPLKLDPIEMSSLIELKEGECIEIVDGRYCVVQTNTFSSDPIKIDAVKLHSTPINPSVKTFELSEAAATLLAGRTLEFDLSCNPSPFDLSTGDVPDCIVSVDEIGADLAVTITLSFEGLGSNLKSFLIRDLRLQIPKGLMSVRGNGSYDENTGIFTVPETRVTGTSARLDITASALDFAKSGARYDAATHTMTFADNLSIASAHAIVTAADVVDPSAVKGTLKYTVNYNVADINIKTFTGSFKYDIEDLDIPTVDLSNLPDVLSQSGTDVSLVNPQLYLNISNPMADYGIHGSIGMDISAIRKGSTAHYPMGSPLTVEARNKANYCLSPIKPAAWVAGYPDAIWHRYADLGRILSGDGLPTSLQINVVEPKLPTQHVTNFRLGETIGAIEGSYYFIAPLEFAAGSRIVYTSDATGWGDDDLDKLTITALTVSAKVTSDVPVNLHFTGYPIDREGNQINGVTITGGDVPAFAKDYELVLTITGEIQKLDGIRYTAVAAPKDGEDAPTLTENMTIVLNDVRAKVSGNYTTDL